MLRLLSEAGIQDHVVETSQPSGKWTAFSIAHFHQNRRWKSLESGLDNQPGFGASDVKLGPDFFTMSLKESSAEHVIGKEHTSRICDGCGQVSLHRFFNAGESNMMLENLWYSISLCYMLRF
jgi:hypothetical protein